MKQQRACTGAVVIGRNEGERLRACLHSTLTEVDKIVYVDSGSTDESISLAQTLGVAVHSLRDEFTAARARNEGFRYLCFLYPDVEFVQFIDGDCELAPGWMTAARVFLEEREDVAAACGRRRERYPERSVYNFLCDVEWNTPIGRTRACGGDVMIRLVALQQVGGFRDDLIAGEEPELCVRLRTKGWQIWRLDADMTLHDAAILHFSQWWKRCTRAGFAYAEGVRLHGRRPELHWVRESRSAWAWGAGVPVALALSGFLLGPVAAWGLAVYPIQVVRLALRFRGSRRERWLRAFFLVAGKVPEAIGQLRALRIRIRKLTPVLIEYK